MGPLARSEKATWTDYQSWTDDERWEIIDGEPYQMAAPNSLHQMLCTDLCVILANHFRGKPCRVISSPLDVRLSEVDVVQPDLLVICDKTQITKSHIEGPPSLVVEVLSPSSLRHDKVRKARLYAKAGVGEYWIVQPSPAMVEVLYLDGIGFRLHGSYTDRERLVSPTFPELSLELSELFPFEEVDEVREGVPRYRSAGVGASG